MKEKLTSSVESITVGIMGGKVNSYRKKQEEKTTIRVYKDGYIGVAGAIGECNEAELTAKAEKMLENKIPYPCIESEALERSFEKTELNIKDTDIIRITENLLARLAEETPNFLYSQSVRLYRTSNTYESDGGRRFSHKGAFMNVGLIIKDKGSANVFDTSYFVSLSNYDEDKVVGDIKRLYEAYYRETEIEEGEYVVAMSAAELLGNFVVENVHGEMFSKGASLLSGKMGEKLFNERVSMYSDYTKDPEQNVFFDDEGIVVENDRFYYIKNGVFCGVSANKRISELYNLPLSGSADSAYDSVPVCGVRGSLDIEKDGRSFDEIADGRKVILPLMASGGDYTKTGDFSTPVQMALVYENGKLLGRVKGDFSISANFFDMLGKSFEGSAVNILNEARDEDVILVKMSVKK